MYVIFILTFFPELVLWVLLTCFQLRIDDTLDLPNLNKKNKFSLVVFSCTIQQ